MSRNIPLLCEEGNALLAGCLSNARRARQEKATLWVAHRRRAAGPELVGCAIPRNRPTCRAARERERVSLTDDERAVSSDRRFSHSEKRARRPTTVCSNALYLSSIAYLAARWCE